MPGGHACSMDDVSLASATGGCYVVCGLPAGRAGGSATNEARQLPCDPDKMGVWQPSLCWWWRERANQVRNADLHGRCVCAGLSYIPAPKPKLPGHEESYNPPKEYLPSEVRPLAYLTCHAYVLCVCTHALHVLVPAHRRRTERCTRQGRRVYRRHLGLLPLLKPCHAGVRRNGWRQWQRWMRTSARRCCPRRTTRCGACPRTARSSRSALSAAWTCTCARARRRSARSWPARRACCRGCPSRATCSPSPASSRCASWATPRRCAPEPPHCLYLQPGGSACLCLPHGQILGSCS